MRQASLLLLSVIALGQANSTIPPEVRFKSRYLNPIPKPQDFTSVMLWGIAIADKRVSGYESATVEIERSRLICRADGKDVVLNDDVGSVRGGLYRRNPWFGTDAHDPMPLSYSDGHQAVILKVGTRPDKVWHFWAGSARASLPQGHLEGCTVTVRARIFPAALLQVGFDYWRNSTVEYGNGGNNHEAGAGDWHFPSGDWQEGTFTNVTR